MQLHLHNGSIQNLTCPFRENKLCVYKSRHVQVCVTVCGCCNIDYCQCCVIHKYVKYQNQSCFGGHSINQITECREYRVIFPNNSFTGVK